MKATLCGLAMLAMLVVPAPARSDDRFSDGICENATPVGRHLNALVEANDTLTPELMATALQMRDVYEQCVTGYDTDAQSASGRGGEQFTNTNGAIIGRLYARLALARALQRVGQYDVYDKNVTDADKAYAEAIRRLDEIRQIEPLGNAHPGTPERSLVMKAEDLRPAIVAARAALLASPGPSAPPSTTVPTPAPSSSASPH